MLAFVRGAKVVFIIPLPRYVHSGCCKNTEHVSNRLSGELAAEFAGAEKCLLEAASMGERTGMARIINLLSFFDSGESPPQDLTTVDGTSIWAGNGVHLTSNASRVASGHRWRGRRAAQQESETGVCCASPCACQEKGRGNRATADLAAQTRSATAAALALRPAATDSARARIRTPKP